jgi:Reverse transcriptase (RNA-dependent DNA polymerase)
MCLQLKKSIYGLVQAAHQWRKKFKSEMDKIGFINSQVVPCLLLKVKNGMKCVLTLYVEDSILSGDKELIEDTINKLENYLGC